MSGALNRSREERKGVAKTVMPEIRIDEQLFRLLQNPGQYAALAVLIERPASKSDVAKELGIRLNKADYDVRQLEKMGFVEAIDTERRRGMLTTIYRAVMRPVFSSEEWDKLSQEERERYVLWAQQLVLRDIAVAWRARTFQARAESHSSRSPLRVDELGWIRINRALDDLLALSREAEVESVDRAREAGDESKLISIRVAMFSFEMPSKADLSE
jgi:DNA-binding MarR family transcriptional regulator